MVPHEVGTNPRAHSRCSGQSDRARRCGASDAREGRLRGGYIEGWAVISLPLKDALLQGLLEHLLENRAGFIEDPCAENEKSNAALLNRLIDADFDLPKDERIMAQGLIAASAENPDLLTPAREHVAAVFSALSESKHAAAQAQTIFLASQGLQFLQLLGLLSLTQPEQKQIRRHLKKLIEELQP